jgi:hypothetical protein
MTAIKIAVTTSQPYLLQTPRLYHINFRVLVFWVPLKLPSILSKHGKRDNLRVLKFPEVLYAKAFGK